jgi:hypothetical protein
MAIRRRGAALATVALVAERRFVVFALVVFALAPKPFHPESRNLPGKYSSAACHRRKVRCVTDVFD